MKMLLIILLLIPQLCSAGPAALRMLTSGVCVVGASVSTTIGGASTITSGDYYSESFNISNSGVISFDHDNGSGTSYIDIDGVNVASKSEASFGTLSYTITGVACRSTHSITMGVDGVGGISNIHIQHY